MTKLRTKMIELMEREQYAKSTIRNYVGIVAQFAQFHGKCSSTLGEEHVAQYLDHLCRRGVSISLLNITHSGLRWFYTEQVLSYLGRYTHRVAIANHRLIKMENDQVYFRWKDYRQQSQQKVMKLDAKEFICTGNPASFSDAYFTSWVL